MGFWDSVGKAVGSATNAVLEKSREMQGLRNEYVFLSEDELFRKLARVYNSSSKVTERAVIIDILKKEHGHDLQSIKSKLHNYI